MIRLILRGMRATCEASALTARLLREWLEWGDRSVYRAGLYLYLILKLHATPSSSEALTGWSPLELYCAGTALYIQVLFRPTPVTLLIASPLLYLALLYMRSAQETLGLSSSLLLAGALCAYLTLSLLELAERDRASLNAEERVYEVEVAQRPLQLLSKLRALSAESLMLSAWVSLSPLVLYAFSPPLSLTQAQRFEVSFPYLLFLLTCSGATLGLPESTEGRSGQAQLKEALRGAFASSLTLCALLCVLYLL